MKIYLWILCCIALLLAWAGVGWASDGAEITVSDGKPEYKKGNLDIDALTSVITEKQDELKSRIVQEIILKYFENTNFASYLYVSRSLTSLLTVKNKSIMQRELLANTADYVLVYVFIRFFMQMDYQFNDSLHIKNAKQLHKRRLDTLSSVYKLTNAANLFALPFTVPNSFVKSWLLAATRDSCNSEKDTSDYFNDVLMDMAFDVLYQCPYFRQLGFFNETNAVADKYDKYKDGNLFIKDTMGLFQPTGPNDKSSVGAMEKERRKYFLKFDPAQQKKDSVKTLFKNYITFLNALDTNMFNDKKVRAEFKKEKESLSKINDDIDTIRKSTSYDSLKIKKDTLIQIDATYRDTLDSLRARMKNLVDELVECHKVIKVILANKSEIMRYWNTPNEIIDSLDCFIRKISLDTNIGNKSELIKTDTISFANLADSFKAICSSKRSADNSAQKPQKILCAVIGKFINGTANIDSLDYFIRRISVETNAGFKPELLKIDTASFASLADNFNRICALQSSPGNFSQNLQNVLGAIKRKIENGSSLNKLKSSLDPNMKISIIASKNLERLLNFTPAIDSFISLARTFNAVCALQRDTSFSALKIQNAINDVKKNIVWMFKEWKINYCKKHLNSKLNCDPLNCSEINKSDSILLKVSDFQHLFYLVLNRITCANNPVSLLKTDSIVEYFENLSLLDTLGNHAQNYERILKMAEHAGDLLQSQSSRNAVNTIIAGIRRYSTVDEKEDKISIDVQSMIVDLYKRYSDRSNKTWIYFSPYFTVGINASVFYTDSTGSPIPEARGDSLTRFSFSNVFAGEKIGIKWKIWNFKYCASFDEGDAYSYYWKKCTAEGERHDPTISDIHLIGYVSGILYNLVNVKTKKDFTAPIFGLALGATFFNGLDLNVGGGLAYQDKHNSMAFLSASFDVDIVEYLSKLGSKIAGK
jgi:hypothetical protein